jgi:hypothetical protein
VSRRTSSPSPRGIPLRARIRGAKQARKRAGGLGPWGPPSGDPHRAAWAVHRLAGLGQPACAMTSLLLVNPRPNGADTQIACGRKTRPGPRQNASIVLPESDSCLWDQAIRAVEFPSDPRHLVHNSRAESQEGKEQVGDLRESKSVKRRRTGRESGGGGGKPDQNRPNLASQ